MALQFTVYAPFGSESTPSLNKVLVLDGSCMWDSTSRSPGNLTKA